jgi:hypothetical protein
MQTETQSQACVAVLDDVQYRLVGHIFIRFKN